MRIRIFTLPIRIPTLIAYTLDIVVLRAGNGAGSGHAAATGALAELHVADAAMAAAEGRDDLDAHGFWCLREGIRVDGLRVLGGALTVGVLFGDCEGWFLVGFKKV